MNFIESLEHATLFMTKFIVSTYIVFLRFQRPPVTVTASMAGWKDKWVSYGTPSALHTYANSQVKYVYKGH